MYRMMIVDDEILVRVGLKSTIDWESIGFTIVAEASNGEQAYELFQKYSPDVVMTDIKMPKMDGLKLTELIKSQNPKVKVILLTCYDEFTYAREAIKLGASNYVLKSEIEDEELINLMKEIRSELDKEMDKIEKYSILQHQINSNLTVLKEKLLSDLIESKVTIDDEFNAKCEDLNLNLEGKSFVLAVMYKDNLKSFENYSEKDWQLMDSAIVNIAMEILTEKGLKFLVGFRDNSLVLLIINDPAAKGEIEAAVKRIKEAALNYLNISLTVVLSSEYKDISRTSHAYKKCEERSQLMFYNERGSIIHSDRLSMDGINTVELKENYTKAVINYLDEENLEKAKETILNLEELFRRKHAVPFQVRLYYISLVNDILEHYYNSILDESELSCYSSYNSLILNSEKLSDITKAVITFIEGVINSIRQDRLANSKNVIHKSINYIEKNYSEKISLESIAEHVNLSKQYLCYIFKRETGENVSHYINKVRVEKAKELIKKYDYKAKELFDKVGFSDQHYFSKTFKKITGMTIGEYRKRIAKETKI